MPPHNFFRNWREAPWYLMDPGTGEALENSRVGTYHINIAASASETNTLAAPSRVGLLLGIVAETVGASGTRVVTVATAYDEAGGTTITFSASGQWVLLMSFKVDDVYLWRVVEFEGVTGPTTALASLSLTGLTINTAAGTGIDFPAGETYGKALAYGTFGTPIIYSTDEPFEIHGRHSTATEQKPLVRIRASAPAATAMTTGAVRALQAQAYGTDTSDIAALQALEAHVGIKAACEIIADVGVLPNMRAGWFKIEDLGNVLTLTGDAAVLCLGFQFAGTSTLTGNADWMFLAKEGGLTDPADAFVRVYDGAGGGWATNLFDVPASAPATVASATYTTAEGYFTVKVGGSTYRMPFYTGAD